MKRKIVGTLAVAAALSAGIAWAESDAHWDKTFAQSAHVVHERVSYPNRYGIKIAADMYRPKDSASGVKHPALIVGTPYGGVKEQGAGIYAQTMAERGFVTIAFDASYNGESGGEPRHVSSPDIFAEDFSAAVDFLGTRPFVDREKIGVIGICGSGAFCITAAQVDHRIKAVATASMYDMSRVIRYGWKDGMSEEDRSKGLDKMAEQRWKDGMSEEDRSKSLDKMGEQRWKDFESGAPFLPPGFPDEPVASVPKGMDAISSEFFEYYGMKRGHHPRSHGPFTMTSNMAFTNFPLMNYIKSVSPRPILFIIGEKAHSRYFTEDAYRMAAEPKELYIVPGARHIDLYDRTDMIPFDKLTRFFKENLNKEDNRMTAVDESDDRIFEKGSPGPKEMFTGTTWVKMLVVDGAKTFDTQSYDVRFEPGARTYWHSHPGGQLLFVTSGKGFYQEKGKPARVLRKGDVVEIPPDVIHWHGAAADAEFVHLGVSARTDKGPARWCGPVTDEEYAEAIDGKQPLRLLDRTAEVSAP